MKSWKSVKFNSFQALSYTLHIFSLLCKDFSWQCIISVLVSVNYINSLHDTQNFLLTRQVLHFHLDSKDRSSNFLSGHLRQWPSGDKGIQVSRTHWESEPSVEFHFGAWSRPCLVSPLCGYLALFIFGSSLPGPWHIPGMQAVGVMWLISSLTLWNFPQTVTVLLVALLWKSYSVYC